MTDIFEVADWVSSKLKKEGFVFAFIGGVALQAWGEPRVTRDVDLTVLIGFGDEESRIAELLKLFPARIDNASNTRSQTESCYVVPKVELELILVLRDFLLRKRCYLGKRIRSICPALLFRSSAQKILSS